jgi:hypothetical protein
MYKHTELTTYIKWYQQQSEQHTANASANKDRPRINGQLIVLSGLAEENATENNGYFNRFSNWKFLPVVDDDKDELLIIVLKPDKTK